MNVAIHGCGEFFPRDPTGDEVADPENRRVEIFCFHHDVVPPVPGRKATKGEPQYAEWVKQVTRDIDVEMLRQSSLELVTSGRTATVSRPAFGAASVEDSTIGSIPVRACFAGAWLDREHGVLVGELQHACQAGGDGCIVQPTGHVVQLSASSGSAPAKSPAAAAPACEDGMTRIPAGVFTMGSPNGLSNERPPHVVRSASFCLDTTEVTVAGYRDCIAVTMGERSSKVACSGAGSHLVAPPGDFC